MPQKVLKFTGINRKANEFQNSGACEELINLRPGINGGHSVVRPKAIVHENVSYDRIYDHSFGDIQNKLAVTAGGEVYWLDNYRIDNSFSSDDVQICTAGNIIVIYSEKEKKQVVYKFEDGLYTINNTTANNIISASIRYDYSKSNPAYNVAAYTTITAAGYDEAIGAAASGFYEKYPNGLCGASVVGCTYEMENGSEAWSTAFVVANVARCDGYKKPSYVDVLEGQNALAVYGASNVYLDLKLDETRAKGMKRINVYASRPVMPYKATSSQHESLTLSEVNLDAQIMYYQGSISLDDVRETQSLRLNFSNTLAGEKIMDVTSGRINRIGSIVSYNNRFHYYRSEVNHIIQAPTISDAGADKEDKSKWVAYVKFNDNWKLINNTYEFSQNSPNDFIYPMAGVKQMVFVKAEEENGQIYVPYTEMFYVTLKDSSAYNYSFAFDVTPHILPVGQTFYDIISDANQLWGIECDTTVFWKKEANAINVSDPYNPLVFPVKYSYSFGGEIIDISTSYLPISSTQVGMYPLSVFTTGGVYSLEQGDGNVLYSNIVPLQPLVANGKVISTPHGTFFVSSNSLYLLSGRDVANVSYVLNGELELTLRELESYKKLCCNGRDFFDFSPVLSDKEFELFISSDVSLVYDQLNNELYISNKDNVYSYVLNLDTKTYHKIAKKYLPSQSGARYAIEIDGATKNIIDLHDEETGVQDILLQSRPMSLEMAFTHIQRLILLADTKLEGTQNLCFSVFASDNLYDWKCIISAQKQKTVLRQIRTNRAAKSYRDYVILITGTVDTDTDISDIIADYTVVNRHIG